jgi:hypothetical protein
MRSAWWTTGCGRHDIVQGVHEHHGRRVEGGDPAGTRAQAESDRAFVLGDLATSRPVAVISHRLVLLPESPTCLIMATTQYAPMPIHWFDLSESKRSTLASINSKVWVSARFSCD